MSPAKPRSPAEPRPVAPSATSPAPLSRRGLLGALGRLGGGLAAGAAAAGEVPVSAAQARRPALAWTARTSAQMPPPSPEVHLLNRCAWGPTAADLERVRTLGIPGWIEEQLDPSRIDASAVEGALSMGLPTLGMDLLALEAEKEHSYRVPDALNAATLYRQVYSPRRLYELMVDFWSDHFSLDQYMEGAHRHKTIDDREVIRPHALGRFKDLLTASARSVAMLRYLNNELNVAGALNENYAREIMELHTLGVAVEGQPYSETDVLEVARCFTGWSWAHRAGDPQYGAFRFYPERHDRGLKRVLGQVIPAGGGENDALRVIDLLCAHPATARFLATKLVRRFVADDPATHCPELVERVAGAYLASEGDIPSMLRVLLNSDEFATAFGRFGGRLHRPMELAVRLMRASAVPAALLPPALGDPRQPFHAWYLNLVGWDGFLNHMGHVPFAWLTPDGYPDVKESWTAAVVMLYRWNLGLALAEGRLVPHFRPASLRPAGLDSAEAVVDHWTWQLVGRPLAPADRALLLAYFTDNGRLDLKQAVATQEDRLIALILDSPYLQWR